MVNVVEFHLVQISYFDVGSGVIQRGKGASNDDEHQHGEGVRVDDKGKYKNRN